MLAGMGEQGFVSELFFPRSCAGCGRAGAVLCSVCRWELRTVPHLVKRPIVLPGPVWSLGPYGGAHRGVIIAMKERGNQDVRSYVGAVILAAIEYLQASGELPEVVALVPAPTRVKSARRRGGDPVETICQYAARSSAGGVKIARCLRTAAGVSDQSELDAARRQLNIRGAIELRARPPQGVPLVLVDDVITTGATMVASMDTLTVGGGNVCAGVTIADA